MFEQWTKPWEIQRICHKDFCELASNFLDSQLLLLTFYVIILCKCKKKTPNLTQFSSMRVTFYEWENLITKIVGIRLENVSWEILDVCLMSGQWPNTWPVISSTCPNCPGPNLAGYYLPWVCCSYLVLAAVSISPISLRWLLCASFSSN